MPGDGGRPRPTRRRTGVPVTSTCGWRTSAAARVSFEPSTRWSSSTPRRRPGPGSRSRTTSARSSMPSSRSTTTPTSRRSSPHTFSTSSASWMPSTRMRLARATRAPGGRRGDRARRGAGGGRAAPRGRGDEACTAGRRGGSRRASAAAAWAAPWRSRSTTRGVGERLDRPDDAAGAVLDTSPRRAATVG